MNRYIIFLVLLVNFQSCVNIASKQENISTISTIPVEKGILNLVEQYSLSDVVKDIEIIPLETTDESVFRRAWNISVGENDLFINTFETILRFDRQSGKFLNQIGKMGQGPTDIFYCSGCGLDDTLKRVYTLSRFTNEIKTFTYTGIWENTLKAAQKGSWMEAGSMPGASRTYYYINGKHVFRRMLPIQDGTKSLWQLGIMDSMGQYLYKIVDPACVAHEKSLTDHEIGKKPINTDIVTYAISSDSPVLNRYQNLINYLFDGNDTIYQYDDKKGLSPRFVMDCGKRPDFNTIHTLARGNAYYSCIFVSDMLETKDDLFILANQDVYAYLLRINKKDGTMSAIRNKGEYKESSYWMIKYPVVETPGFTNDLCGGLDFYPYDQNEKQWIAIFDAVDLLEKIDLEELKATEVVMPDKKEQLIRILGNLKEDDNPVVMIATLK